MSLTPKSTMTMVQLKPPDTDLVGSARRTSREDSHSSRW